MSIIPDVIEQRTVQAILDSGVFEKIIKKEWELDENVKKEERKKIRNNHRLIV